MDEKINQIVSEFGFKPKSIRKSKYLFICKNDKGIKSLKSIIQPINQVKLADKIKHKLIENNFKNVDNYYLSLQGQPYFKTEDETYIMTDYIDYPECDFSNANQMIEITKAVALIHKLGTGYDRNSELQLKYRNPVADFEKGINRLHSIKKMVCSQKKYSDFDIIFIRNYDIYLKSANEAFEILKNSKINEVIEQSKKTALFCHNSLKEENILIGKNGIFITNFDTASPDHYIFDLYQIIERYMRKKVEPYLSITDILNTYESFNKVDENLYPILYALLKFPFRFIKICNSFYDKKRSWVPNSTKEQIQSLITLNTINENYLQELKQKLKQKF